MAQGNAHPRAALLIRRSVNLKVNPLDHFLFAPFLEYCFQWPYIGKRQLPSIASVSRGLIHPEEWKNTVVVCFCQKRRHCTVAVKSLFSGIAGYRLDSGRLWNRSVGILRIINRGRQKTYRHRKGKFQGEAMESHGQAGVTNKIYTRIAQLVFMNS